MIMPTGRERLAQDRASRARREEARDLLHVVSEQHGGARGDALAVRVAIDGVVLTERCLRLEGETEALRRLVLQLRSDVGLARQRILQAEERAEAAPAQARQAVEEEVEALRLALSSARAEACEARAQAAADVAAAEARVAEARTAGQSRDVLAELQRAQGQLERAWAEVSSLRAELAGRVAESAEIVQRAAQAKDLRYRLKLQQAETQQAVAELDAVRAQVRTARVDASDQCLAVVDALERLGSRHAGLADRLSSAWLAGPHPMAAAARELGAGAGAAPAGSVERGVIQLALAALVTEALRSCPAATRARRASGGAA
jgi:chromosome segregation ATPase